MANKISEFSNVSSLQDTDELEVLASGNTRSVALSVVKESMNVEIPMYFPTNGEHEYTPHGPITISATYTQAGTGSVAFEVQTNFLVGFEPVSLPVDLSNGHILKVIASGVGPPKTITLLGTR